jgi:hypothetical protein
VIAFIRTDGVNYTLIAIRNQAGTTPSTGWGVCYGEDSSYYAWTLDSKTDSTYLNIQIGGRLFFIRVIGVGSFSCELRT